MRSGISVEAPVEAAVPSKLIDAAFAATPNGVVIQEPSGVIMAANRAAEHILGLTGDELRGRASQDDRWGAVDADGRPLLGENRPAMVALRTRQPVRGVVMGVRTPAEALRWLRVDAEPIIDDDGVLAGVTTFFVDITDQRDAEGAWRQAESRLEVATRAGRVGVFEWDPATATLWGDEEAGRICGSPELCKTGPLDTLLAVVHPDDRARAERQMRDAFTSSGPSGGAFRVVHPDGTVRFVIAQADVRAIAEGSRLTGAIVDVTDLHGANQRVVDLLESMPEAYFTIGHDYRFSYLNPAAEALLGRDRSDLAGRVLWQEFPEIIGSQFEEFYRSVMDAGHAAVIEAYYPPHRRWYEVHAHAVPEGLAAYFRDVTARHAAAAERERLLEAERAARVLAEQARSDLAFNAAHDSLTKLPSRESLHAWIAARLQHKATTRSLCVGYIDLDRFKRVNDSWGHSEGDRLLAQVAERLRRALRPEDFLARLGGDEFVAVLEGMNKDDLMSVTERLMAALRTPFDVGGRQIVMTASIGLVFAEAHGDTESLIRDADAALFRAKDTGRNRIVVFDDEIRAAALARVEIEADLRDALSCGDVVAHYQPAFSMTTGAVVGLEALARWTHPRHGSIPPNKFIPVASETGLIAALTTQVLDQAAGDARAAAAVTNNPELVMWVNVTPQQLAERHVADAVLRAIRDHELPERTLGIEVVETALLVESDDAARTLRGLASHGVPIAIDDFGTGHSSLNRLHRYPVDLLKIDRSFVARLADPAARPIVAAIVHLAHAVGAKACAEGIETDEQLQLVRELGVDCASGFHLAMPESFENLSIELLRARKAPATDPSRSLATTR